MPSINVSERTWERLKERAIPFEDKEPQDVIRRLLDQTEGMRNVDPESTGDVARHLISRAGRIPHGRQLRAKYKGREFFAEVNDGRVIWNGRRFSSLSQAAVAVIQSTGSNRPTENGWRFWEVKNPDTGEWVSADSIAHPGE